MEFLGYVLAMIMGVTLGLFGGGGSILTVPILVYVLMVDPILATAYSLFVVGFTSIVGSVKKAIEGLINWQVAFLFAIPSLLAVFLTRYFLVPNIPENLLQLGNFMLTKEIGIMLFFAVVMLFASWSMIRDRETELKQHKGSLKVPMIIGEGLVVGLITGLVGAGGGFLIVPALVLWVGLPMKKAVGTSLVIIALKSLVGFVGDLGSGQEIDWLFLLTFSFFSVAGIFVGLYLSRFISSRKLKKTFGWFIVLMAIFIIMKELQSF